MIKKGKIYAVSLGPGDPELLTIKGLKILQKADKIYYPGSLLPNGQTTSFSLPILQYHQLDPNKLTGIFLNMSDNRTQAQGVYKNTFSSFLADYQQGLTIAFVSEGDSLFYSTFAYLLTFIQDHRLELEIIAGVPSVVLATAQQQIPLALLNQKVAILPRVSTGAELEKHFAQVDTIVLIKIKSTLKNLLPTIQKNNYTIYYCEHLGTPKQYLSTEITQIKDREIPYFSLLILKK